MNGETLVAATWRSGVSPLAQVQQPTMPAMPVIGPRPTAPAVTQAATAGVSNRAPTTHQHQNAGSSTSDPLHQGTTKGTQEAGARATALIEDICSEKIGGCRYREGAVK